MTGYVSGLDITIVRFNAQTEALAGPGEAALLGAMLLSSERDHNPQAVACLDYSCVVQESCTCCLLGA